MFRSIDGNAMQTSKKLLQTTKRKETASTQDTKNVERIDQLKGVEFVGIMLITLTEYKVLYFRMISYIQKLK